MATGSNKAVTTWGYVNITSATSTQVKTGAGTLHLIVVNATAAGTVTIIDGVGDSDPTIGQLKASVAENYYQYDLDFATGLRIVTAGASNLTVVYR